MNQLEITAGAVGRFLRARRVEPTQIAMIEGLLIELPVDDVLDTIGESLEPTMTELEVHAALALFVFGEHVVGKAKALRKQATPVTEWKRGFLSGQHDSHLEIAYEAFALAGLDPQERVKAADD